jgi:hypothetical protein
VRAAYTSKVMRLCIAPNLFRISVSLLVLTGASWFGCHTTSASPPDDTTPEDGSGGTEQDAAPQDEQEVPDGSQGGGGSGGSRHDAGDSAQERGEDADAGAAQEPGPGEMGGLCKPGDQCAQGSNCQELAAGRDKRCTIECTSNYACPDTLRCEAVSQDSMFCLFGPRGKGATGQPCGDGQKGLGCASGLCVNADPEEAISVDTCTDLCKSSVDCVVPFPICVSGVDLCLPIMSGDLGGLCTYEGKCVEGGCLDVGEADKRCTRMCTAGEDCGQPYLQCTHAASAWFCLMKSSP